MSTAPQLTPTTPGTGSATGTPTGTATGSAPAAGPDSKDRINNAYSSTFAIPPRIKLDQFDGSNWLEWSRIIESILILQEAKDLLNLKVGPSNIRSVEWTPIQRRSKAYLRLYIKLDIYSLIASDVELPSFCDKWEKLKRTYGGASGSTTVFNLWRQITQCKLEESTPMAAQLAKINEMHIALFNASMGITIIAFGLPQTIFLLFSYLIYLPFTYPLNYPVSPSLANVTQTPMVCLLLLLFIFVHCFTFIVSYG